MQSLQGVKKILDNIQNELMPNFKVAHRTYKSVKSDIWSKWIPWVQWKMPYLPNYRQILPNELVFESDFPTRQENETFAQLIIKKLKDSGYSYNAVFTGNKSIHIHVFFKANKPEEIDKTKIALRIIGPELFNEPKLDKSNFLKTRMIQIENAQNPKTGNMPEKIDSNIGPDIPVIDSDYITTLEQKKKKSTIVTTKQKRIIDNGAPHRCGFLEYAARNPLPEGSRHLTVEPNLAAYINFNPEKEALSVEYYNTQQNPNTNSWRDADAQFNCSQLKKYAKSIGITNPCELCEKYKTYKASRLNTYIKLRRLKRKKNISRAQCAGLSRI